MPRDIFPGQNSRFRSPGISWGRGCSRLRKSEGAEGTIPGYVQKRAADNEGQRSRKHGISYSPGKAILHPYPTARKLHPGSDSNLRESSGCDAGDWIEWSVTVMWAASRDASGGSQRRVESRG